MNSTSRVAPLTFIADFSIPLVSVNEATADAPSLLLRLREFLNREQMNHHVAHLGEEVKTKHRHNLENEKVAFAKELELLSGSIPNTAVSFRCPMVSLLLIFLIFRMQRHLSMWPQACSRRFYL